MRVLFCFLMLVSVLRAAEAEVVIKAFISLEEGKVWFQTDSKERVMLSFTGSHLDMDRLLTKRGEVDFMPRTHGFVWFMSVPREKPNVSNFMSVYNTEKLKLLLEEKGELGLSGLALFKFNESGQLLGPLTSAVGTLKVVKEGDVSREGLLLIPLKK